jgi:probable rRNA maturation factor
MIEVQDSAPKKLKINKKLIELGVQSTLNALRREDVDVTVRLTNDEELKDLNHHFRGVQGTTDVLSFNQDYINPETQKYYLGDIIISKERALEQSKDKENTFDEECLLLVIHGTLHLLGYDHYQPEDKEVMWKLQETILKKAIEET